MLKYIVILTIAGLVGVLAKPLTELKLANNVRIDTDHVDCKTSEEVINDCGLQQGFSYRFHDFAYPTNHTHLMSSCRRQADALKCLKAYSRCLPPLSRQVLVAMVNSRQKFNKKLCVESPTETSNKFLEFGQCMQGQRSQFEKGVMAELNAILVPEAIMRTKSEGALRLKQSCCAVAQARKDFTESALPLCKKYSTVATEELDSYLETTTSIICPDLDKLRNDCEKLAKLPTTKLPDAKFFLKPILNVVQTLA